MLENVSDAVLLGELKELVTKDNRLTARLLLHLSEVDARQLYLAEGYSSMFVFCVKVLLVDESTAFKRIHAARAARRFPVILDMVASGDVHLTGLRLITPHMTAENHADLLAAARHRSKREIEQLVAERFPAPELPTSIRKLPSPRTPAAPLVAGALPAPLLDQPQPTAANEQVRPREPSTPLAPAMPCTATQSFTLQAPPRAPDGFVTPVGPGRWRLQTTLSGETYEKLRRVQDLARHRLPDGDVAAVLDMALDLLAHKLEAERFGVRRACPTSKRKSKVESASKPEAHAASKAERKAKTRSRYIPAETRRRVFARDGARCTFIGAGGHRCAETGFLELDHLVPWARGGANDPSTMMIRCHSHNQHAADRAFGKKFMDQKRRARLAPEPGPTLRPDEARDASDPPGSSR